MKVLLTWCACLWFVLVIEQARTDLLPTGSVLIPAVVVGLLWIKSQAAIFFGAAFLMFRWILNPIGPPIEIGFALIAAPMVTIRQSKANRWHHGRKVSRIPWPLGAPIVITILAIGCLTLAESGFARPLELHTLLHRIVIAVPFTGLMMILTTLADGMGIRQRTQPV